MSKRTVLVTSASGRIGKELVARLAADGSFTVRATSFSPDKADMLRELGADEVVPFDLNEASTWDVALDGVSLDIPAGATVAGWIPSSVTFLSNALAF